MLCFGLKRYLSIICMNFNYFGPFLPPLFVVICFIWFCVCLDMLSKLFQVLHGQSREARMFYEDLTGQGKQDMTWRAQHLSQVEDWKQERGRSGRPRAWSDAPKQRKLHRDFGAVAPILLKNSKICRDFGAVAPDLMLGSPAFAWCGRSTFVAQST